uniref:Secreted protein n=1 Tax=Parascaris univalens TaxID=6257 RepID=A0A915BZI6_PARUN
MLSKVSSFRFYLFSFVTYIFLVFWLKSVISVNIVILCSDVLQCARTGRYEASIRDNANVRWRVERSTFTLLKSSDAVLKSPQIIRINCHLRPQKH